MLVSTARKGLVLALVLALLGALTRPAHAQETPGGLSGEVLDSATGAPLEGVTVTAVEAAPAAGAAPAPSPETTGADGRFAFPALPPGRYELRSEKAGYRPSRLDDVVVRAGQPSRVELQLAPLPPPEPELSDVEEFVVIASPAEQILAASRFESDQLLNTLGAEDFAKLAVSDVADALKFVPGVNVVEGQFAVIRGLEDRYSSTLYNSASVPSPDPDRQSVQLDLFPSDVVSDLAVSKTFGPELPSNSSGGSINIVTHDYPEELEFKLSAGSGLNDNAWDDFLEFVDGSAVGSEEDPPPEQDFAASLGGRGTFLEREIRFKAAGAWETDYETREGFQESREPARTGLRLFPQPATVVSPGGLSLGELGLSAGRFELTESEYEQRVSAYAGLGFDLDEAANHRLDASFFYTDKEDDTVQAKDNGFIPFFDYAALAEKQANGQGIVPNSDFACCATLTSWIARSVRETPDEQPSRGPLWYASFFESESFERERDLLISQLNGDHRFEDALEGLHVSWAGNYVKTTQDERSQGLRYFFEPVDTSQIPTQFPTTPDALGPGSYVATRGIFSSQNEISERQGFGRLDVDYEIPVLEALTLKLSAGGWYEDASRDVAASFLESPSVGGVSQFAIPGPDPLTLAKSIPDALDPDAGVRNTTNESSREIEAWYLGSKATLYEQVDVLAGFRVESIFIESLNEPFIGEDRFGAPETFPTRYLFFDRLDNPARDEVSAPPPEGTSFNDQVLGIDVPVDPDTGFVDLVDEAQIRSFVNGRIDEDEFLPSVGLAYRPLEGLALRGAWSRTVARPSFREMGFYVSVEPGSDDLIVGNPQLGLSDVESWDARLEYTWGDLGDLAALSLFQKTIEDPIESIVVRNPLNFEGSSSALFRTFFNNENTADLRGIELEARKNLGFLGPEWLAYLSLGGNFTWIDAEVDRSDIERIRSMGFFGVPEGSPEPFKSLEKSRRLFGQPEWIANADISFDHPDWGTKASLVLSSISDVLDAAGSAVISPNGDTISFTPDRYIDSFYQLDLVLSQRFHVDFLRGDLTLKFTARNLTDSRRRIIYDPDQTRSEIAERSYRIGRDFSLSLTYAF